MNIPAKITSEFQCLVTKSLEQAITDAEIDRIHEIFREYPEITALYHKYITVNLALRQSTVFSVGNPLDDAFCDLLTELAEQEKTAPSVELPAKPAPLVRTPPKPVVPPVKRTRTLPLLAAVCTLLLLATILILPVKHWFDPVEVATVTDLFEARVEGPALTPHVSRLTDKSAPITVTTGVMKVVFDCGAKVVIEGPAQFQVKSVRHILLNRGKLYAQVAESGRGFRVDTPSSHIVDLGTEFGIRVPEDQATSVVSLYRGQATVNSVKPNGAGDGEVLTQGEARQVTAVGEIRRVDIEETAFIRDFDSRTKTEWRGEWLTVVPLPARDTDRASGLRADKTYTHLLDFGYGTAAVINGVAFTPVNFTEAYKGVVFRDDSLHLILTRFGATAFRPSRNSRHTDEVDGGMQELLSDCVYISDTTIPDHFALSLSGLTAGQRYSLRLYYCKDQGESVRPLRLVFNGEGHDKEVLIDEQAGGAHYVRYDYTAGGTQVDVAFLTTTDDESWRLFGLSNEVIDVEH